MLRPMTGFTVRLLEMYHTLALQSKVNGFDFYHSIVTLTDGSGLCDVKVRLGAARLTIKSQNKPDTSLIPF